MPFGLNQDTINELTELFKQFKQIDEVFIYGSRAMGNFSEGSDIDLTLKGENLNSELLTQITLKIDDLLLPYLFDLSIFDQLQNQSLKDHIQRVGQTLYRKG